jgi:hypothetical protein
VNVYRTYFVTDTVDSLVAAIDQANRGCTSDLPCMIAFRLGTPTQSGYFTIRPKRGAAEDQLHRVQSRLRDRDRSASTSVSTD